MRQHNLAFLMPLSKIPHKLFAAWLSDITIKKNKAFLGLFGEVVLIGDFVLGVTALAGIPRHIVHTLETASFYGLLVVIILLVGGILQVGKVIPRNSPALPVKKSLEKSQARLDAERELDETFGMPFADFLLLGVDNIENYIRGEKSQEYLREWGKEPFAPEDLVRLFQLHEESMSKNSKIGLKPSILTTAIQEELINTEELINIEELSDAKIEPMSITVSIESKMFEDQCIAFRDRYPEARVELKFSTGQKADSKISDSTIFLKIDDEWVAMANSRAINYSRAKANRIAASRAMILMGVGFYEGASFNELRVVTTDKEADQSNKP